MFRRILYRVRGEIVALAVAAVAILVILGIVFSVAVSIQNNNNIAAAADFLTAQGYAVLSPSELAILSSIKLKTDNLPSTPANELSVQASSDGVYVDTTYGTSGTLWPIGTSGRPVDTVDTAKTIAIARNTSTIYIRGFTASLNSSFTSYTFKGRGFQDVLALNGQDVDFSQFSDLQLTGNYGGTTHIFTSHSYVNTDDLRGNFEDCLFEGTFNPYGNNVTTRGSYWLGGSTIYFDTLTSGQQVHLVGDRGKLILRNLNVFANNVVDVYGDGLDLAIDASNTMGTINVYGSVRLTNNTGGATVNDYR